MSHPVVPSNAQPCVWMSAGLLTYKLCDRDFDCERCPLDAGLRGHTPSSLAYETLSVPGLDTRVFPEDRLYTHGHSWVQLRETGKDRWLRFGLDAFAAAIVGRCQQVRWQILGRALARGETLCQIDLGLGNLSIGAPLRCTVRDGNAMLRDEPLRVITAPYGEGWLADLETDDLDQLGSLMRADAARDGARLDLHRFRRRVALRLLAEGTRVGRTLPDGGEQLVDLRQILGGPAYLELLPELVH